MRKLIISVLLVIVTGLKAQNRDSLKTALKNAKYDTVRCNILRELINSEPNEINSEIYLNQIIAIGEKNNNLLFPDIYNAKGSILALKGDITNALAFLNLALKISKKIKDKIEISSALSKIGEIYMQQGDLLNARNYFNEAIEIQTDKKEIAHTLFLIGQVCFFSNDPKSLFYSNEAIKIQREIGDKFGEANSLNNIGRVNEKGGDYKSAINNYLKCLEIHTALKYKSGIAQSYNNIGNIYAEQKNYKKASDYSLISLNLSKQQRNIWGIKNAAKTLKEIYQKQNEPAKALEMYELYIKMRDSVNNQQTHKAVIQKQFQIEYEKKAFSDSLRANEERKITTLKIEKQSVQIKQERTQKIALFGGLGLVIIFAGVMFNRFKVTQRQKTVIENHQKEILASIRYAKRIQTSLITSEAYIEKSLSRLQIL